MSDYSLTFNTVQIGKKKYRNKMKKTIWGQNRKKNMMGPRTIDYGQNGNKSWWSMSDYSLTF